MNRFGRRSYTNPEPAGIRREGYAMRVEFLAGCGSAREARRLAPWAAVTCRVGGGYMVWESKGRAKPGAVAARRAGR